MTDYMGILRMKSKGFSATAIASSLGVNKRTVLSCIDRAAEAGFGYPFPDGTTNESIKEMLYRDPGRRDETYVLPDFSKMDEELKKSNMTLVLLWNRYVSECRKQERKFYQHTQFCELYRRHIQKTSVGVRIDRNPGESLELDWAGGSLYVHDPVTDERIPVSLFVATLSFSAYFYAEAFIDQKVHSWILANRHALEFFGGVPMMLIPDNLKTAVITPDRYEPDLNEVFLEFAEHYRTVVMPARVRKPKDKPNVEASVGFATRRIIADVQDMKFFSLDELNTAIWERMDAMNAAPFTKKPGSRLSLFTQVERPKLSPLPPVPYQFYERIKATVAPDIHIEFDKSWYSVPWKHLRHKVQVKATATEVSIFDEEGTKLLASHTRSLHPGGKSTDPDHLPANIREVSSWNGTTFRRRAAAIGPSMAQIVERILASRDYEVQSYRTCLGVLNLAKNCHTSLLEAACARALELDIRSRKGIRALLSGIESERSDIPETVPDDETLDKYFCCHDQDAGFASPSFDGEVRHD